MCNDHCTRNKFTWLILQLTKLPGSLCIGQIYLDHCVFGQIEMDHCVLEIFKLIIVYWTNLHG